HSFSIAIAATIVSANDRVRPFLAHWFLSNPARRPERAFISWHSSESRNDAVRSISSSRTPAYTSAMLSAVVEKWCPSLISRANNSRLALRDRSASIRTVVSSKRSMVQRALVLLFELGRSLSERSLRTQLPEPCFSSG